MASTHEPPSSVILQAETVSRKPLQMDLLVTQIDQRRFGAPGLHCRACLPGGEWRAHVPFASSLTPTPSGHPYRAVPLGVPNRSGCQKLDVSSSTVYRLVKDKKLVPVKLGERASGITTASMNRYIQQLKARSDG